MTLVSGGAALATAWANSVEAAMRHIRAYPQSGSLRYADATATPALRHWRTSRFPYLVFYIEHADSIDCDASP